MSWKIGIPEVATGGVLEKKLFLQISQNSQEMAQVFSFGFWETSKDTFFTEHIWVTASGIPKYGSESSKYYLQRKWFSKDFNWMPTLP